jgi:hypothetical protein
LSPITRLIVKGLGEALAGHAQATLKEVGLLVLSLRDQAG